VQAAATLALTAPSVMAPVVAPLLGLPPQRIGWFVGLAYLTAMFSGLVAGGYVSRTGPIRMSRWAVLACCAGLLFAAAASIPSLWPLLLLASIAIGVGYGLPNPSASMVIARHAPPQRRGLYFSIKQTGVPVGVGLAGLLVPPLLDRMDWPDALAVLAALCATLALALHWAGALDAEADAARPTAAPPAPMRSLAAPLAHVWRTPSLKRLAVASLVFSMTQLCFVTFLVSYLKLELGLSLAAAAGVLSVSQLLSVGSRILWGQVADRWIAPLRLLGLLGVAMGMAAALLGALPAESPTWAATGAALLCAATAMAWNGVFYAELARRVTPDALATVTGGTQFLTFAGAMAGPVAFATLVGPIGSHGSTYMALAVAPLVVGLWLLAEDRER
jgi:MFS family permease